MKELRQREAEKLAQCQTARTWQKWDLNPGIEAPDPMCLTTVICHILYERTWKRNVLGTVVECQLGFCFFFSLWIIQWLFLFSFRECVFSQCSITSFSNSADLCYCLYIILSLLNIMLWPGAEYLGGYRLSSGFLNEPILFSFPFEAVGSHTTP